MIKDLLKVLAFVEFAVVVVWFLVWLAITIFTKFPVPLITLPIVMGIALAAFFFRFRLYLFRREVV